MVWKNIEKNFIDSMHYMNAVLESLAVNVPIDKFKYVSQAFQANQLKLVKRKEIYLYNYIDSFKTFGKEVLPNKNFYSMLKYKHVVSVKDYKDAKEVFNLK